jgi:hypothetical protein
MARRIQAGQHYTITVLDAENALRIMFPSLEGQEQIITIKNACMLT